MVVGEFSRGLEIELEGAGQLVICGLYRLGTGADVGYGRCSGVTDRTGVHVF